MTYFDGRTELAWYAQHDTSQRERERDWQRRWERVLIVTRKSRNEQTTMTKRIHNGLPKPVIRIDVGTGRETSYPSVIAAARASGVSEGSIRKALKGQRTYSGGFMWRTA